MMLRLLTFSLLCFWSFNSFAQASPWLPEPETGSLSLTYVFQTADKFYRAERRRPTPGNGEDLNQHTLWLNAHYGFNDRLAFDLRTGYAQSDFITGPGIPTIDDSFNGLADSNIGVTWRVIDEFIAEGPLPSVALRAAAIIEGDYDTGYINSIGDGGSGVEGSIIVGKLLGNTVGLLGELGYRSRSNDIPEEVFVHLSGYYMIQHWTASIQYQQTNATSGLDIGGPGFSPSRFPELEEDKEMVGLGLSYDINYDFNVGFNLLTTVNGRNTDDSHAVAVTVGYSFSLY
ncbi:MAG: hypothetical protein SVR94_05690 [Pseudomonadota bacterium]|nr:hypothetical protein [Pseudomonadota bacterium]